MADPIVHPFAAQLVELPDSFDAINDYFYDQGWTDGLPIVPPTRERVEKMLAGMAWRDPAELIAVIPPAMGQATLTKIATNCVMAGCRPEYLPVVVAAIEAVSEPIYGLAHRQTTTHAAAPLILVNGPMGAGRFRKENRGDRKCEKAAVEAVADAHPRLPSICLQASSNSFTASTETLKLALASSFSSISTTFSTPPAPRMQGTPT